MSLTTYRVVLDCGHWYDQVSADWPSSPGEVHACLVQVHDDTTPEDSGVVTTITVGPALATVVQVYMPDAIT